MNNERRAVNYIKEERNLTVKLIRKDNTATSLGCLSKGLYRDNIGDLYLVKGNMLFSDGHYGYEPFSEAIASVVAEHLGFKHIHYKLIPADQCSEVKCYGIEYASICKWQDTKPGTQRLTALQYMELSVGKRGDTNYWQIFRQYNPDVQSFLSMLVLDAIIGNEDRHLNNWELFVSDGGVEMSPIFDNGASLLSYVPDNKISSGNFIGRDKAKPFKHTHELQVALIKKYYPKYKLSFTYEMCDSILASILKDIDPILKVMDKNRADCVREYLIKRFKYYTSLFM